jgi:2-hydroxy-6-oxonona-2,4-dienedioate hydrolase
MSVHRSFRPLLVTLTLGSCLIAAAFVAAEFNRDVRHAYAQLGHSSQVAQTACGPIEYAVAGSGPPVLLVHGSGGGFDQGLQFGAPLVEAGFTVIAPSRFGYLRTPVPSDVTPASQARAHVCLLDALHIERVAAFGGSAGAPSAAQLCLRHPERCSAMVLVVPALFSPATGNAPPSWLAQFVIRTSLNSEFLFWLASHFARDTMIESVLGTPSDEIRDASPSERARVLQILQRIAPIRPRAAGLLIDATVTTAPSENTYEQINTPTLIVSTRNDGFRTAAAAENLAQQIPDAKLLIFEDGGHLWVGHQQELWHAVEQFLREPIHSSSPTRS